MNLANRAWPVLLPAAIVCALGADRVSFNKEIRPIMADTCFRCHGPDKGARMAGLRLDRRDEATKTTRSGVTPIVPGDPAKSAIVDRIFTNSNARVMPPAHIHKELTEQQKLTVRRWVEEGAEYEDHWSYRRVERPAVPGASDGKNPVDAFILARLEKSGLKPSPEADRRTLLRRVTLDLTGIPPTPEETNAFLADLSPAAYEKAVNRLLASPRFAEKQAIHWLDAVRYADTSGFHGDNAYPVWPYRDYVLRAFGENKPFDVFTREQLAGDLLPGAEREQLIASTYNRLNRTSAEGGVQPKEYLAKYGADRVRTLSSVWLGATVGCAECHDHKFDPYASRDFYSLKAFFADIEETGLVPDRGEKAWGAVMALPAPEQESAIQELDRKIAAVKQRIRETMAHSADQRKTWESTLLARHAAGEFAWKIQHPLTARTRNGAVLTIFDTRPVESNSDRAGSIVTERAPIEGMIVAGGPNPDNETYTVTFRPGRGEWTAVGIQIFQDESLQGLRFARGGDHLAVSEIQASVQDAGAGTPARKVPFSLVTVPQTYPSPEFPAMAAIDGDPNTAWGIATYGEPQRLMIGLRFAKKLVTTSQTIVTLTLRHDSVYRRATIGRFRLMLSSAAYSWPLLLDARGKQEAVSGIPENVLAALKKDVADRKEADNQALDEFYAWSSAETATETIQLAALERDRKLLDARIPRVLATRRTEPAETRVLPRGNFLDETGDVVVPSIPAAFGKLELAGEATRATRLDLANWLTSRDNPLTARVYANRMWRQFFGTGLSKILDDLGSQGETPTHPELLDWLAAEFMNPEWQADGTHPWDIRHLVRTVVVSRTYRQASITRPELEQADPYNRLLARQTPLRVDAETVRDVALAVSGLLAEKTGGPSVKPYQPQGYLGALNFPKRDYSESRGSDLYRRGIYTHWQRTFLHPGMLTFDAPTREECVVNRTTSNTPLQALVLLNDPIYVEAARVFAQNALPHGPGFSSRLRWIYQRALGRDPSPEEQRVLGDLHRKSLARFQAAPAEAKKLLSVGEYPLPVNRQTFSAPQLAALTTVTRAVLNLSETITRN